MRGEGSKPLEAALSGISGKTLVFCVLGHPVGHSLSPAMQNAALRKMGVDGVYVAFDVDSRRLSQAITGLEALGVAGINCTIPHKEALLPLMDEVHGDAATIGAVNTVVFRDGKKVGHNTDGSGFLASLQSEGVTPERQPVVVLGAGGSARAVVMSLARCQASVTVASRTFRRAQELCRTINAALGQEATRAMEWETAGLHSRIREAALLVNTTPLGMSPAVEAMPEIPVEALGPHLFAYDLIYNPLETRFLREVRQRGGRTANGAGMLAQQGALALSLWIGKEVPVEVAGMMERIIVDTLSPPVRGERCEGSAGSAGLEICRETGTGPARGESTD